MTIPGGLSLSLHHWHPRMAHLWWLLTLNYLPAAAGILSMASLKKKKSFESICLLPYKNTKTKKSHNLILWVESNSRYTCELGVHWGLWGFRMAKDVSSLKQSSLFWGKLFPSGVGLCDPVRWDRGSLCLVMKAEPPAQLRHLLAGWRGGPPPTLTPHQSYV